MEVISEWVRNIFVLILALTFIEILLPSERMSKYIRFIFSMIIMASIMQPLTAILE